MFSCNTLISTQTMPCFSRLRFRGGYMKISSQPPFVHCIYMCVQIFWLISFYLWLVFVFLFSRVYYGFTPLQHQMSRHYMSQQLSRPYAWPHTWWLVIGMPIMPLGLMYILKLLYAIRCCRVTIFFGFQFCWQMYKRPSSSLLFSISLKFLS